jgi:hypothetical protein
VLIEMTILFAFLSQLVRIHRSCSVIFPNFNSICLKIGGLLTLILSMLKSSHNSCSISDLNLSLSECSPHDETPVSIKYRINELTSMLLHRSELQIVIVGHTKFLARWSKRPVMKQLEIKTFELCAD